MRTISCAFLVALGAAAAAADPGAKPWLELPGPGKGKHVVLVSGDEEYRSEEALPQLGQDPGQAPRLQVHRAVRHRPERRHHRPQPNDNIPGLEALKTADLMIIFTRFRNLPDEQMKHIVDYVESGRPIIGMRTATHAFNIGKSKTYARSTTGSGKEWDGRLRPAGARRDLGQPPRQPRQAEHARHPRQGRGRPPDPARHQGRRHLGPDRRLRRAPAAAGRQQAAGAGPGARRA